MHALENFNARKLREAAVPLKEKPLRDTVSYIKSLVARERVPSTTMGYAFLKVVA